MRRVRTLLLYRRAFYMIDEEELLWRRCSKTGKVQDYLAYAQSAHLKHVEEADRAAENERHDFKTTEYR